MSSPEQHLRALSPLRSESVLSDETAGADNSGDFRALGVIPTSPFPDTGSSSPLLVAAHGIELPPFGSPPAVRRAVSVSGPSSAASAGGVGAGGGGAQLAASPWRSPLHVPRGLRASSSSSVASSASSPAESRRTSFRSVLPGSTAGGSGGESGAPAPGGAAAQRPATALPAIRERGAGSASPPLSRAMLSPARGGEGGGGAPAAALPVRPLATTAAAAAAGGALLTGAGITGRLLQRGGGETPAAGAPAPQLCVFSEARDWAAGARARVDSHRGGGGGSGSAGGASTIAPSENGGAEAAVAVRGKDWAAVEAALRAACAAGGAGGGLPARLPHLRHLALTDCGLSPSHVARLPEMPALESLDLSDNPLGGLGALYFEGEDAVAASPPGAAPCVAAVQSASAGGGSLGATLEALRWLRIAPSLRELKLRGCGLRGVPSFSGLAAPPRLASVDLSCNLISSPAGLAPLAPSLRALDLSANEITGVTLGIRPLAALSRLAHLKLHPNPVTLGALVGGGALRTTVAALLPALVTLDGAATPVCGLQRAAAAAAEAEAAAAAAAAAEEARAAARRAARAYGAASPGAGFLTRTPRAGAPHTHHVPLSENATAATAATPRRAAWGSGVGASTAAAAAALGVGGCGGSGKGVARAPSPSPRSGGAAAARTRLAVLAQPHARPPPPPNAAEAAVVAEQAARNAAVRERAVARRRAAAAAAAAAAVAAAGAAALAAAVADASGADASRASPPPPSPPLMRFSPTAAPHTSPLAAPLQVLTASAWLPHAEALALSHLSGVKHVLARRRAWFGGLPAAPAPRALAAAAAKTADDARGVLRRLEALGLWGGGGGGGGAGGRGEPVAARFAALVAAAASERSGYAFEGLAWNSVAAPGDAGAAAAELRRAVLRAGALAAAARSALALLAALCCEHEAAAAVAAAAQGGGEEEDARADAGGLAAAAREDLAAFKAALAASEAAPLCAKMLAAFL
jgi:hypothetical protein